MGFLIQFLEVFSELKGNNLWLAGESVSLMDIAHINVAYSLMPSFSTQDSVSYTGPVNANS